MTLPTGRSSVLSAAAVVLAPFLLPAGLAAGTTGSAPPPPPSLVRRAPARFLRSPEPVRPGFRARPSLLTTARGRAPSGGGGAPGAGRLAVGGVLGGGVGFFVLGFLGAWLAEESASPSDDLAAVGGFLLGGLTGEVLGVAAGVHMADGGRGSFWADLGTSALGALGFLAAAGFVDADGADAWALTGAAAAAQVGFTVRTELRTR